MAKNGLNALASDKNSELLIKRKQEAMGGSMSKGNARCDKSSEPPAMANDDQFVKDAHVPMEAPPSFQRPRNFEEKLYDKVCLSSYVGLLV
jgi:hypothetical protein